MSDVRSQYVVQRYRHKILHVAKHWRQLTMSLAYVVYLSPDLQTTSLAGVVYVCFDRRTTALTRGSRCRVATAVS